MRCLEPLGYLDFLGLEIGAGAIVTDSGGVQEEASALGVPCFTLRRNTERPVTITQGTNTLLGDDPAPIADIRPARSSAVPARIGLGRPRRRARRRVIAARSARDPRGRRMTVVADRVEVLGCAIDRVDMGEAAGAATTRAHARRAQHMAVNAAKIVAMRHDDALRGWSTAASSSPPTARRWCGRRACSATRCPRASPAST